MLFPKRGSGASAALDENAPVAVSERTVEKVERNMTLLCSAIALYSLMVIITYGRGAALSLWLMIPVPLSLALWFGYGFMQPAQSADAAPDLGLLMLCAGWSLATLSLIVPQGVPQGVSNASLNAATPNVTASICGVLALLCIVLGSALSLRRWSEIVRRK